MATDDLPDPVTYRVDISHFADGSIVPVIHGIAEDERSRQACAYVLRLVADMVESPEFETVSLTRLN